MELIFFINMATPNNADFRTILMNEVMFEYLICHLKLFKRSERPPFIPTCLLFVDNVLRCVVWYIYYKYIYFCAYLVVRMFVQSDI